MSTPINNGGPAFPVSCAADGTPLRASYQDTDGMSLRDWFAGQALTGVQAPTAEGVAAAAYRVADAMLAAREGK
jgi:hypothetical protein